MDILEQFRTTQHMHDIDLSAADDHSLGHDTICSLPGFDIGLFYILSLSYTHSFFKSGWWIPWRSGLEEIFMDIEQKSDHSLWSTCHCFLPSTNFSPHLWQIRFNSFHLWNIWVWNLGIPVLTCLQPFWVKEGIDQQEEESRVMIKLC
jgi:hypothetical protein